MLLMSCGEHKPSPQEQTQQQLSDTISRWHGDFVTSTQNLQLAAEKFCQTPNANFWLEAQHYWREAMSDWQAVAVINFGPVLNNNQQWKVQFWPDKHNLVAKKIKQLLASNDPIDEARIEKASVVIQGLSGLEYLLFDESIQPVDYEREPRRCDMLNAITSHTVSVAKRLNSEWRADDGTFYNTFRTPGKDNKTYKNFNAVLSNIVEAMLIDLENVRWKKLGGPMGIKGGSEAVIIPNPYLSEAWRSKNSLALVRAKLAALSELFNDLLPYLDSHPEGAPLAQSIQLILQDAQKKLASIPGPLTQAISHPPDQEKLLELDDYLGQLIALVKQPLPDALGITLGFNANDGD